jgi:SAM-dependent methyltransferase
MDDQSLPPAERFAGLYAAPRAPWDIGRPQRPFVEAGGLIVRRPNGTAARVIDVGCGTGDLAIWLAEQGCAVTGVDFLDRPLEAARAKARERGLKINFLRLDALAIGEIPERFDAATDCGLFHTFDDAGRAAYIAALTHLLPPSARLFILCMADAEPGAHGPRRVSATELRAAFARGWEIETIEPARFEVVPGIPGAEFSAGGARSWFVTVRRV